MDIVLTPEERSNLLVVAERRGVTPEELLAIALESRPPPKRGVKSNGWCARSCEFLGANPVEIPKVQIRRRKKYTE